MSMRSANHPTLSEILWFANGGKWLRWTVWAVLGAALLTVSAKIKIPFWPVPLTMQLFVVLILGMAMGWRLAVATVLLYLAEGAVGLPVFAGTPEKGVGLAYMTGPTGGYLLGFVLAAGACGWLAERGWDRNVMTTILAMTIGVILIYVPGVLWLGSVIGWEKPVLEYGLFPFLPGDALKVAFGALLTPTVWRLIGSR